MPGLTDFPFSAPHNDEDDAANDGEGGDDEYEDGDKYYDPEATDQ